MCRLIEYQRGSSQASTQAAPPPHFFQPSSARWYHHHPVGVSFLQPYLTMSLPGGKNWGHFCQAMLFDCSIQSSYTDQVSWQGPGWSNVALQKNIYSPYIHTSVFTFDILFAVYDIYPQQGNHKQLEKSSAK